MDRDAAMRSTGQRRHIWKTLKSEHSYDQESAKVPPYYNRTGPGMYEVNTHVESRSNRHRSPGLRFQRAGLAKGFFENNLPKHRFTDYSKAELCFKMIECSGNQGKSRDTGASGSAYGKTPTR